MAHKTRVITQVTHLMTLGPHVAPIITVSAINECHTKPSSVENVFGKWDGVNQHSDMCPQSELGETQTQLLTLTSAC